MTSLTIVNANVVDVRSGDVFEGGIVIRRGRIAEVGDVGPARRSGMVVDAHGGYAIPGLVDGHIHVESSMLSLTEFAKAVLPHGTTTIVTDPHEIANVLGVRGIRMLMREAEGLPFNVFFTVPSCVPSAPGLETSGAKLDVADVEKLMGLRCVVGLGEVMDFRGVLERRPDVVGKIDVAVRTGKVVDGHAPGLRDDELREYFGAGITSDHEICTGEEALRRIGLGACVMVREGSLTRSLHDVALVKDRLDPSRCLLVSDDLCAADAVERGHMDFIIRRAVEEGFDPITAVRMATLNPASYFRIDGKVGSIEEGKRADIVLLGSLERVDVGLVIAGGRVVARLGKLTVSIGRFRYPKHVLQTLRVRRARAPDFQIRVKATYTKALCRVIRVTDRSLITREGREWLAVDGGLLRADPRRDIAVISVVERHRGTGNVGLGFVQGFGLREGALASSVSHDSHNLVVIGMDEGDMALAINHLAESGGGLCVTTNGRVLCSLPLPVAGLLSNKGAEEVARKVVDLKEKARRLGVNLQHPFMTMSFLSLAVIPELKITDKGLVDVRSGAIVPTIVHLR